MTEKNSDERDEDHGRHRRTRRLSIFLILGIVALVAIGSWVFSSWYTARYGNSQKLEELPPPPALGDRSSSAKPQ